MALRRHPARAHLTRPLGRMPYDHAISTSPDDLAAPLERIFDDEPADAVPDDQSEVDGTDEGTELSREMDLLRDQLEAAFAEVVGQVDQLGRRVAVMRRTTEAHSEALRHVTERSEATVTLAQEIAATLDAAVAASREPSEPDPLPVDLGPVVERLDHLEAAVSAAQRNLGRLHDEPLEIDTRRLEDVASRGSLHNAADIANLRRDIESLTDSARSQEKSLRDLRTTVDWIKDRLLR